MHYRATPSARCSSAICVRWPQTDADKLPEPGPTLSQFGSRCRATTKKGTDAINYLAYELPDQKRDEAISMDIKERNTHLPKCPIPISRRAA